MSPIPRRFRARHRLRAQRQRCPPIWPPSKRAILQLQIIFCFLLRDTATAAAKDHAGAAANCRNDEEAAWKRLVVNNEFPALNEVTSRKCNEPPFPDSYVAKESCARYQLQAK